MEGINKPEQLKDIDEIKAIIIESKTLPSK